MKTLKNTFKKVSKKLSVLIVLALILSLSAPNVLPFTQTVKMAEASENAGPNITVMLSSTETTTYAFGLIVKNNSDEPIYLNFDGELLTDNTKYKVGLIDAETLLAQDNICISANSSSYGIYSPHVIKGTENKKVNINTNSIFTFYFTYEGTKYIASTDYYGDNVDISVDPSVDSLDSSATENTVENTIDSSSQEELSTPTINKSQITLYVNNSATLKIENASGTVIWSSYDDSIVTVSSKGVITANKEGVASVTATIDGIDLTCEVSVKNISISKTKLNMYIGDTNTLQINGSTKKITWKSSNNSVATITSKGKVTAKGVGTATITGIVNGKSYTCKVKVIRETPNIDVWISSNTNFETSLVVLEVTNNGRKTVKITADDSYLMDNDFESYNRRLYLANADDAFKKIKYVNIKPGKTKTLCFLVNGSKTWYDEKTYITYTVIYDGKSYVYSTSSYTGTDILLKN